MCLYICLTHVNRTKCMNEPCIRHCSHPMELCLPPITTADWLSRSVVLNLCSLVAQLWEERGTGLHGQWASVHARSWPATHVYDCPSLMQVELHTCTQYSQPASYVRGPIPNRPWPGIGLGTPDLDHSQYLWERSPSKIACKKAGNPSHGLYHIHRSDSF